MSEWAIAKRVAVVVAVLFAALNYVALVRLGFAGQVPDLNPLGATPDQIFAFKDALGFEGRQLYNQVYRPLDFGFVLGLLFLLCLVANALRPKRFWWVIVVFAAIFGTADLTENQLLAELINDAPQALQLELASQINLATRVKFAAVLLAFAAMITCWRQEGANQ